eukprot:3583720-Rhodomonas_salina.1
MLLRSQDGRPKTAVLGPGKTIWSGSSSLSGARPSVSAGRPRDRCHEALTPRPPRTPPVYDGPARNFSNPKHDPSSPSQISRGSLVRMGAPGTPELSAKIPRKSRDVLLSAASPQTPDSEFEPQSRAQSSFQCFERDHRSESADINQRLRHELAAANRAANKLSVKNNELVLERDKY